MKAIRKILSHPVFQVLSLIICGVISYGAYFLRKMCNYPYKDLYLLSYIMLIISFLIFLVAYKDKNGDTKTLVKESISGYFFFITFIVITLFLRG